VRDQTRYWSRRLLVRRYTEGLRPEYPGEFSARIEHDGEGYYFALGTAKRTAAARQAATIYHTVLTEGWRVARRKFPREITVAVLWAVDPLACTYTTLVTTPEGNQDGPSRRTALARAGVVWIVEADPDVGRTLATCVERHLPGSTVAILAAAEEALRLTPHARPALVLLNRDLPDIGANVYAERVRTRHPDLPVFTYGAYSDSDRLFLSFGGVRAGYILRRRPPGLLLEPLGLPLASTMRIEHVSQRIRRYFQSLFDAPAGDETRTMARLTPREQEILEHLSKGYVDKEIAQRLGISAWTVHGHLRSIFDKLQVHTRTEAAVRYLQK
jgi:DNA-binding NarL/FixJ family response regulator